MKTKVVPSFPNMKALTNGMVAAGKAYPKSQPRFRFRANLLHCSYSIECVNTHLAIGNRARKLLNSSVSPLQVSSGQSAKYANKTSSKDSRGRPRTSPNWSLVDDYLALEQYQELYKYFNMCSYTPLFHNNTDNTDRFTIISRADDLPIRYGRRFVVGRRVGVDMLAKNFDIFDVASGIKVSTGMTKYKCVQAYASMSKKELTESIYSDHDFFQKATLAEWVTFNNKKD